MIAVFPQLCSKIAIETATYVVVSINCDGFSLEGLNRRFDLCICVFTFLRYLP